MNFYDITDIASNISVRDILKKELDLNDFFEEVNIINNSVPLMNSNSRMSLAIEGYILFNQYKIKSNPGIESRVNEYRKRLNDAFERIKSEREKYNENIFIGSSNFDTENTNMKFNFEGILFYLNVMELYDNTPLSILNLTKQKLNKSEIFAFPYTLAIKETSFIKLDEVITLEFEKYHDVMENSIKEILKNLYSKKKISVKKLISYLYFQNLIIFNLPIYFDASRKKAKHYLSRFRTLFNDNEPEIEHLVQLLKSNKKDFEQIGNILDYQLKCSYNNIRGRIDFLTNNSMIEIKSGKPHKTKDILQASLYILISEINGDLKKYGTTKFKIYYTNYCKYLTIDIDKLLSNVKHSPKEIITKALWHYRRT